MSQFRASYLPTIFWRCAMPCYSKESTTFLYFARHGYGGSTHAYIVQRTRKLMIGWMNTNQGPLWTIHLKIRGATQETMFMHMLAMAPTRLACQNASHCMTGSRIRFDDLWSSSRSSCRETYIFLGKNENDKIRDKRMISLPWRDWWQSFQQWW